jgi:hypothetical protein
MVRNRAKVECVELHQHYTTTKNGHLLRRKLNRKLLFSFLKSVQFPLPETGNF